MGGGSSGDGRDAGIPVEQWQSDFGKLKVGVNFNGVQEETACFMTWGQ